MFSRFGKGSLLLRLLHPDSCPEFITGPAGTLMSANYRWVEWVYNEDGVETTEVITQSHRHRGRGCGGVSDRRRFDEECRKLRRPFFGAATQWNHHGVGIALEAVNVRRSGDAREGIKVAKSGVDWHRVIVTDFAKAEKAKSPWKVRASKASGWEIYPHESPKSQFSKSCPP
jgi:hypothetical protein